MNTSLLDKDAVQIDNLELDDQWTHFFKSIGDYDFRDEVNVEVLGHLHQEGWRPGHRPGQ